MATKSKRPSRRKQKRTWSELSGDEKLQVKRLQMQLANVYRQRDLERARKKKEKERQKRELERQRKEREKQRKERETKLRRDERTLKQWGFFPKAKSKKYTRQRTKTLAKRFEEFLRPKKFFFVPVKSRRKETLKTAKKLELDTTPRGILVPRQGSSKAKLRVDRKTGERRIETFRVEKTDKGTKKEIKRQLPLASLDEIERQKEKWKKRIKPPKAGERLKFKIVNGHIGYGTKTFGGPNALEELFKWIDEYKKKPPARIHMYRALIIEYTSKKEFAEERKSRRSTRERIQDAKRKHARARKAARKRGNFI